MTNEKPKEYLIDSFKTLLNVITKENRDVLSIDLMQFLYQYTDLIDKVREENPQLSKKTNYQICQAHFTWIDDGHNDIIATQIFNKDTGEITTHNFPKKQTP